MHLNCREVKWGRVTFNKWLWGVIREVRYLILQISLGRDKVGWS